MSCCLVKLALIDCIIEASPLPIFLLILFQFLLLLFQLGKSGFDVGKQVGNLFTLSVYTVSCRFRQQNVSYSSPVSSMILVDSALFCSYTLVPATSLSRFNRSWSLILVKCAICSVRLIYRLEEESLPVLEERYSKDYYARTQRFPTSSSLRLYLHSSCRASTRPSSDRSCGANTALDYLWGSAHRHLLVSARPQITHHPTYCQIRSPRKQT